MNHDPQRVVLVDFNIPLMSLVTILFKLAIAAIPVSIFLFIVYGICFLLFGGALAALGLA